MLEASRKIQKKNKKDVKKAQKDNYKLDVRNMNDVY